MFAFSLPLRAHPPLHEIGLTRWQSRVGYPPGPGPHCTLEARACSPPPAGDIARSLRQCLPLRSSPAPEGCSLSSPAVVPLLPPPRRGHSRRLGPWVVRHHRPPRALEIYCNCACLYPRGFGCSCLRRFPPFGRKTSRKACCPRPMVDYCYRCLCPKLSSRGPSSKAIASQACRWPPLDWAASFASPSGQWMGWAASGVTASVILTVGCSRAAPVAPGVARLPSFG